MLEGKELLEKFKDDVSDDYIQSIQQREDANRDMRFIGVTGGMWEDYLDKTHGEDSDRARLEFDMTSERLFKFVGEWTQNRAGVIYEPDDTATTDDDAKLLTGVYRGDFRENGGKSSQDNAILEASAAGMGAIQLSERFVDEEDPENDNQEIIWKTVHNAFDHVIFDANAKEANKSDARHVTKLTGFTPKAFKEKYPDMQPVSAYTPTTVYQGMFDWYSESMIYIAERFEIEITKQEVEVWQHIQGNKIKTYPVEDMEQVKDELKALGWEFVRRRKIKRQVVNKSIFTGQEFIQKPKRISGKFLPIIPFYAFRIFINGKEHFWGLVRKLIDSNRTVNTLISKLTETSAAAADDINIYLDEQVVDHENDLADNTNKAYQTINKVMDESSGQSVPMGPVGKITAPQIDQSAMAAIQVITNFMQQKTGQQQDTISSDLSGKAVNALIKRQNMGTKIIDNNFIDSIAQVGRVYRSKAGEIYTKPMMKKSIGEDGTLKTVQLNQLSIDPQTANPINTNDLSQGRFSTTVDVGPSYETEQDAAVESIERIIEKLPPNSPLQAAAMSMWINNINGTGLEPLKKLNRRLMIEQGLINPETDQEKQEAAQRQQQPDTQEELIKATTNQQNAEAENLRAASTGKVASAQKDLATAEKTKAETASIVLDINDKLREGAAAATFRRFASNTRI